ncbi:MAG: hypothetical protein ACRDZN_05370 [Acidimicrobiales bacterium]
MTFDAEFSAEPDDGLTAMGDALMEALIDVGAIDPFASTLEQTACWSRSL